MRRIVTHWTVGRHEPNAVDLAAYHLLINGRGDVVNGKHPIEANSSTLVAGKYAAHVAKFNGGSIGIAMCGCFVTTVKNVPGIGSAFPLTAAQWHAAVTLCRQLVKHFRIAEIETRGGQTGPSVIGHCEVEQVWGIKQAGKIDPWRPMPEWTWSLGKTPQAIAKQFREEVWRPSA